MVLAPILTQMLLLLMMLLPLPLTPLLLAMVIMKTVTIILEPRSLMMMLLLIMLLLPVALSMRSALRVTQSPPQLLLHPTLTYFRVRSQVAAR
jgi:hypothetical protein